MRKNFRSQNDRVAKLLHCRFLYEFQGNILVIIILNANAGFLLIVWNKKGCPIARASFNRLNLLFFYKFQPRITFPVKYSHEKNVGFEIWKIPIGHYDIVTEFGFLIAAAISQYFPCFPLAFVQFCSR